jgi:hypothetical protein
MTTAFVLIWYIVVFPSFGNTHPVATHSQEFSSEKACETAKNILLELPGKQNFPAIKAACVPK